MSNEKLELLCQVEELEIELATANGLLDEVDQEIMPFIRMIADGGEWHVSGHWMIDHICHDGPPSNLDDIEGEFAKRKDGE